MNYSYFYLEITCIPDIEVSVGFLMGRVMNALHLAFVTAKGASTESRFGVGFPGYRDGQDFLGENEKWSVPPIGNVIRVFSREEGAIEASGIFDSLSKFSDYVHVRGPIALRRPQVGFAVYSRYQPRASLGRQIARQVKRQGWSTDEALRHFRGYKEEGCCLPYVDMYSHGSRSRYRLFVRKRGAIEGGDWTFSTYGLSSVSALPDF